MEIETRTLTAFLINRIKYLAILQFRLPT